MSSSPKTLPLVSLNHVSFLCKSVSKSVTFYEDVLGFERIKRPASLEAKVPGAWLHKYGIGIHLIKSDAPEKEQETNPKEIDPKDNHISFQCSDMQLVEKRLKEKDIKYKPDKVVEGDTTVDQLFFHDPDGYMIEICNCENLPVEPTNDNNLNETVGTSPSMISNRKLCAVGSANTSSGAKMSSANIFSDANKEYIISSFYMWELGRLGVAVPAA